MFAGWRHAYANMALTGGNLVFLLIALKSPTPAGASLAAGLVGVTSLYAWHANLRRYSAVADTPTSRIASAPQGYVEIVGRGVHLPGARLVSPISGLPCLWYRYISEEKKGNKWHRVDSGISAEEFGLDDGNSIAVIDPDGAAIVAPKKRVRTNGHYRHTEWSLIEGEPLYVLGEHVTIGGANADLDFRQDRFRTAGGLETRQAWPVDALRPGRQRRHQPRRMGISPQGRTKHRWRGSTVRPGLNKACI